MTRLRTIFRSPVSVGYRFRLGGKRYRLGRGGVRALRLVVQTVEQTPSHDDIAWLMPYRGHFREIERLNPRAALTLVIDRTDNRRQRRLAIWLRGRCGGTLGASTVARFSTSSDRALRKEVTRCLKRLSAWAEIRGIAANDPDSRIRKMATPSPPKPCAARIARFSRNISRHRIVPRERQFFVSPNLDVTRGRPPKPRWLIRHVLERIQRVVTGCGS